MNHELVQFIANRLAARELELTGDQYDEDYYLDFAETAVQAYESHEFRTRTSPWYIEGVQFL